MTRRHIAQLTLTSAALFAAVMPAPEQLMEPTLRRLDTLLDDERKLRELGVHHAAIPKPGYRSKERIAHERQRWFRRARAWRAGGEARISRLKHRFGMARSRYRGPDATARTVFWAAIANNLTAIATRTA